MPAVGDKARRIAAAAAVLFLLTFAIRYYHTFHRPHDYDRVPVAVDNWAAIAQSLVEGHGYAVRSNLTGEMIPVAYRPPLYPLFLAGVFRVAGVSEHAGLLAGLALDGLVAVVILLVGWLASGRIWTGILAGLFYTFHFPEWNDVVRLLGTPIYTLLVGVLLLVLWGTLVRPSARRFAATGLVTGLIGLARPTGPFILLVVLAWLWFAIPVSRGQRLRWLGGTLLCFLLVLSPWVVRNYAVFGKLVLSDTNGGINLYLSTLGATPYQPRSVYPAELQARLANVNEFEADRIQREEAIRNILADPASYARLCAKRLIMFFFRLRSPESDWIPTPKSVLMGGPFYLLAFLGWWRTKGRQRTFATFLALFVLYTALLHVPIMAQPRLFFPVLPCLAPLAAMGVQVLLRFFRRPANDGSGLRLSLTGSC